MFIDGINFQMYQNDKQKRKKTASINTDYPTI
jgi:hypothetical protein